MSDSISLSNAQSIIKRKVEICQFDDVIEDLLLEELKKIKIKHLSRFLQRKDFLVNESALTILADLKNHLRGTNTTPKIHGRHISGCGS